jgi:hypothetical protein
VTDLESGAETRNGGPPRADGGCWHIGQTKSRASTLATKKRPCASFRSRDACLSYCVTSNLRSAEHSVRHHSVEEIGLIHDTRNKKQDGNKLGLSNSRQANPPAPHPHGTICASNCTDQDRNSSGLQRLRGPLLAGRSASYRISDGLVMG